MTIAEVKDIVRRAAENCIVWVDSNETGRGHSICAFCDCEHSYGDKKQHHDGCLINELKRIERAEIVE